VRTRRASSCPEHAHSRAEAARADALRAQSVCAQDPEVEFDSLEQALEAGFEIVDIREPQEVSEAPAPVTRIRHVPLAVLLHGQPPFKPTGKSLLMCASGRRSLAATQELRSRGLEEVYSLRGGLLALRARLNT